MRNRSCYKMVCLLPLLFSTSWASIDPTRPPGQQAFIEKNEKLGKLKLEGLVFGVNSWVVINNILIKEGQTKKGIKVLKIRNKKVLIETNEEKIWLDWQSVKIKKKLKQSQ